MTAAGAFPTLGHVVRAGLEALTPQKRDFILGGAETETTLLRNRAAFDRLALRPRALAPLADDPCAMRLLGLGLPAPLIVAPMGTGRAFGPRATAALVDGAAAFGGLACVSSVAEPPPAALRERCAGPLWLQLYVLGEAPVDAATLLHEAGAEAFDGLVMTLDTPIYGRRERDMAAGYSPAAGVALPGRAIQPRLDRDLMARLRAHWRKPLIAKGVTRPEDAAWLIELGVDAIWVSNHGGRQLDHAEASLDSLRRVSPVVAGRVPIILDGGVCRGTDVAKALALGADAVALGKVLALAAAADAVVEALALLRDELTATLRLMGVPSCDALGPEDVAEAEAVRSPSVLGAFSLGPTTMEPPREWPGG